MPFKVYNFGIKFDIICASEIFLYSSFDDGSLELEGYITVKNRHRTVHLYLS